MVVTDTKILVVDDSEVIRSTLVCYFQDEGYQVFEADSAEEAETIITSQSIDVVLLDIRLPGKDGLTLTRELRTHSEIGIILVTGRKDEVDRIIGLECGADEYITKPFNPREILARVKNLARRVQKLKHVESADDAVEAPLPYQNIGTWRLDTNRRILLDQSDNPTQLTEGEYQLLSVMHENAGSTMSRDFLMSRLKNRSWNATDRSIDVLIGRLRKKLKDDSSTPRLIVTVHGAGYLFTPDGA